MKFGIFFAAACMAIFSFSRASALGLGDVQMNSALGFPLEAYLKLSGAETFNPGELKVRLASQDAYDSAGVFRSYYLTRIQFDVLERGQYGKLIRLSTERPILDPYIDLIIEAESDDGSVIRHYPLIVDFPR